MFFLFWLYSGTMGFYENRILPRIIDGICGHEGFAQQRAQVIPRATGRVLEVGYGSGTSLPWYDATQVQTLVALDPTEGAMAIAEKREAEVGFPVEHLALRGEEIPLDAESVDTVVVAYTLCTIPDVERALAGMRRVLKSDGQLLYVEHGLAPTKRMQRWQHRVNPVWERVFGGCQLTRNPNELVERAGFKLVWDEIVRVQRPPPIPGIAFVRTNYLGVASPI
jgi:ubiquinone/menaquinone biosynthesis C-methylase UbiE